MADYFTEDELSRIRKWESDPWDWMAFITARWWMADWGVTWKRNRLYLSTGGWSGNEECIGAMQENFIMWGMTWYSTRRGGHYVFILPRRKRGPRHERTT